MENFRAKHPGLTEEQLQIKYKIWEREKERLRLLEESENKKKYKNPFQEKDDNDDIAIYDGSLDIDGSHTGLVSDAAIVGAEISFIYPQYTGGVTKTTFSDSEGKFLIPRSFGSGNIFIKGGMDTILGIPYTGAFAMDGVFFHNYSAVTPFTHVANHIWNGTPTRIPDEAMYAVMDYIFDFIGVPHSDLSDIKRMFNNDPVKLTIDNERGAKEIQAINTLIDIHADLISALKANYEWELEPLKIQTYQEIGNALLTRVNGQDLRKYFENIFKFHISGQEKNHDKCCLSMLERASYEIRDALKSDGLECTSKIQGVNFMVKNEWKIKALEMTQDPKINDKKIWETIQSKTPDEVIPLINVPF
jgi:hypothetical protein